MLVLRFHGSEATSATLTQVEGDAPQSITYDGTGETADTEFELAGDAVLEVQRGQNVEPLSWLINATPDTAPLIGERSLIFKGGGEDRFGQIAAYV